MLELGIPVQSLCYVVGKALSTMKPNLIKPQNNHTEFAFLLNFPHLNFFGNGAYASIIRPIGVNVSIDFNCPLYWVRRLNNTTGRYWNNHFIIRLCVTIHHPTYWKQIVHLFLSAQFTWVLIDHRCMLWNECDFIWTYCLDIDFSIQWWGRCFARTAFNDLIQMVALIAPINESSYLLWTCHFIDHPSTKPTWQNVSPSKWK